MFGVIYFISGLTIPGLLGMIVLYFWPLDGFWDLLLNPLKVD